MEHNYGTKEGLENFIKQINNNNADFILKVWTDATEKEILQKEKKELLKELNKINIARVAIYNSLPYVLKGCSNSYSNAWCEHFLTIAKILNCYDGEVIGDIYGENGLYEIEENKREHNYYSELENLDDETFNNLILNKVKQC